MSEVSNHSWQDDSEQPVALPTPPPWEAQLHNYATELYAQRNASLRAEIERLHAAFNEISARLVEQTTAAVSEQEMAGLLDHVRQYLSAAHAKAEEDFQTRLAQARQETEQEFEHRLAELRREWEARHSAGDEAPPQRLEQISGAAAGEIEELREQVAASRKALTLTVAAAEEATAQADNFALLKTALEEIDAQRTQSATLTLLLRYAAHFAPRLVLFVVRGSAAVGWKAIGFENGLNDETVKLLNVPTEQPTLLREALISHQAVVGQAETPSENSAVLGSYGSPAPTRALAIPLVVRGKAAAVLYADSGTQSEKAINSAALETLLRATSMSIELLPARRGLEPAARPAAPQPIGQAAAARLAATPMSQQQPAPIVSPTGATDTRAEVVSPYERPMEAPPTNPFAPAAEAKPTAEAELESAVAVTPQRTTEKLPKTAAAESTIELEAIAPAATPVEPEPAMAAAAPASAIESAAEETGEPATPTLAQTPRPVLVKSSDESAPSDSFAPPPTALPSGREEQARLTPAGRAPMRTRQPISVAAPAGETEQRAHNDARRFARLLVSEIKLYNASKVNEGRRSLDLYERLRDEIDRSRKVYDKRVSPAVAARFDYFYDELVQTLAEGDALKLGANCPGPVVLNP